MAPISVDISEIASTQLAAIIRFTGVKRFSFRLKVASAIVRLAGWISPVPVIVEVEHEART